MRSAQHVAELGLELCNLILGLGHLPTRLAYKECDMERHESWPSANYWVTSLLCPICPGIIEVLNYTIFGFSPTLCLYASFRDVHYHINMKSSG